MVSLSVFGIFSHENNFVEVIIMPSFTPAAMGIAHIWASPELIRFCFPGIQRVPSTPRAAPKPAPRVPSCHSSPTSAVRNPSNQSLSNAAQSAIGVASVNPVWVQNVNVEGLSTASSLPNVEI